MNGIAKLKALEQQRATLDLKVSAARKAAVAAARRDDSRRKLLTGVAVEAEVEAGSLSPEWLRDVLDRNLKRPIDRAAFAEGPYALPTRPPAAA
jgi:hypothetical protein